MLLTYFGDIASGQISRGRYFVLAFVHLSVCAALCIGLGLTFGLKNVLPVFVPLALVLVFARLNLAAKRWRDIGLPGWAASLGIAVAIIATFLSAPRGVALMAAFVVFVVEIAWPTHSRSSSNR